MAATEHPHSRFKIDDLVNSIPDTTPGCHPSQSVALYGSVVALKFDKELMVQIKSSYEGRNQIWVPEARVRLTSNSMQERIYMYIHRCYLLSRVFINAENK